jgi:hypothetical protein
LKRFGIYPFYVKYGAEVVLWGWDFALIQGAAFLAGSQEI